MYQEDKNKWSYLAGILDGEGTICLHSIKNKDNYKHFGLQVIVYGTSLNLMKWLVRYFGGVYYTRSKTNLSKKIQYAWHPSGKANREKLLLGILPYLVIKKEQAKLALEFIRIGDQIKNPEYREELVNRCRMLNKNEESVTANMLNDLPYCESIKYSPLYKVDLKIESDLIGDNKSEPVVTQIFH